MKYLHSITLDFRDISGIYEDELVEIMNIVGLESSTIIYDLLKSTSIPIKKKIQNKKSHINIMKIALILKIYVELKTATNPPSIFINFKSKTFNVVTSKYHSEINKSILFSFENDEFIGYDQHYKILVLNNVLVSAYKANSNTNYDDLLQTTFSLINSDHKLNENIYNTILDTITNIHAVTGVVDISESGHIQFNEKFNLNNASIILTPGFNIHNIAKAIVGINESCVKVQDLLTHSVNKFKYPEINHIISLIETRILNIIDLPENVKNNSKLHVKYDGKNYMISLEFDGYILLRELPNVLNCTEEDYINIANQIKHKAIQLFQKPENDI